MQPFESRSEAFQAERLAIFEEGPLYNIRGIKPFTMEEADPMKAPFVEWGRQGGLIGGNARAKKLSPWKRKQIAKTAAAARWAKYRAAKAGA